MTNVSRIVVGVVAIVFLAALPGCRTTLSRDELATEYYNIGSAYFEIGELEKSANYLARAIELEPDLARASYNLARVYVLQDRFGDALELLDILLAEDPDNSLVMETIAYAHYQAGSLPEAASWYERALAVNPTDLDLLQNRAVVALEDDDTETAATMLRRALQLDPERSELHLRLAEIQLAAGDKNAAIEAFADYLEHSTAPEVAPLLTYAELLDEEEFYADSLEVLELVAESENATESQQAEAHFRRGRLFLTEAGEEEQGLDELRSAISLGFADEEAAKSLLENSDLIAAFEVEAILKEAGLVGEEADVPGSEEGEADAPPEGEVGSAD